MSDTNNGTETPGGSREVKAPDGRCIGVLIPTPEDDEGTYELTITPEISRSLRKYITITLEATLGGGASCVWQQLKFHPAANALLEHLALSRHTPPEEELVRLFTIDEAAHGPCDDCDCGNCHRAHAH